MISFFEIIPHSLASAGGGGSGGDDGGGEILFLIGYVPMHLLGRFFRKRDIVIVGNFITWPITLVYSILLIMAFRGYGFVMAIGAFAGAGAGLYGWWGKIKRNKKAEMHLEKAASLDSSWDSEKLMTFSTQVMNRFQYDWSRFDTNSMKNYLTPWYHYHISLMMMALTQAGRQNKMSDVKINEQHIQSVSDATDNNQDSFVVGFEVSAKDELIDEKSGKVLFTNKQPIVEYWTFQRSGNNWYLGAIMPGTANYNSENIKVKQFAEDNKFGYSLDWGWLLLPENGQLFDKGKFGFADINNHVIGMYNNLLIQIYTYSPSPVQKPKENYLIAQVNLPKSYGDILVRRNKGFKLFKKSTKGLRKIETEWSDFNKKYEVYATSTEGATSLELLNPKFMEVLESQPFEVNLEVVGNVVYFYTKETGLNPDHYPNFLNILKEAFKQMKL